MITRTYSELVSLQTFEERFKYLKLDGSVGIETFGFDRYLNQGLYRSSDWKRVRNQVIARDLGCDLAISDREIHGRIIIHHINPIREEDIANRELWVYDPEFLICTSIDTHNAIHYGDESLLVSSDILQRKPNDTCPWR